MKLSVSNGIKLLLKRVYQKFTNGSRTKKSTPKGVSPLSVLLLFTLIVKYKKHNYFWMGGVSIISGTLFRVRQEPFLTSKIIMLVIIIFTFYKKKYYLISSLSGLFFLFSVLFFSHVTVHSVHSNVAKIHSRLPVAMEFWLVCLGILAYSCQNTSRDSGV